MPPNYGSQSGNTPKISKPSQNTSTNSHHINSNHPTHSVNSRFFDKTLAIVKYVIFSLLGRSIDQTSLPEANKVKELTSGILAKHDVYNSLCSNLNLTPSNLEEHFNAVAETIFEDGCINWGRLIALLGFSVKVAEYFRFKGFGIYDDLIVDLTTQFIVKEAETWILAKGGWGNVIIHFKNSGQEGVNYSPQNTTWFKGILVTTATIGLGALFAVACK